MKKTNISECSQKEKDFIAANGNLIEATYDAFGLKLRVAEVNLTEEYYEYAMAVLMGIPISEIEKYDRDLTLALASPEKIKIIAPISGRALIGIYVPRPPEKDIPLINKPKETENLPTKTWRDKAALGFYVIGYMFDSFGKKISTKKSRL